MRRKQLTAQQKELIQRVHEEAVRQGAARYVDPLSGQFVCTAVHHLQRGHCCGAACRHCPYPKEARLVPTPA